MDREAQKREVARNYDAFQRGLAGYLASHRHQFALLRSGQVHGFYGSPGEANKAGWTQFPDRIYSIQEVTDEPLDPGFPVHASD